MEAIHEESSNPFVPTTPSFPLLTILSFLLRISAVPLYKCFSTSIRCVGVSLIFSLIFPAYRWSFAEFYFSRVFLEFHELFKKIHFLFLFLSFSIFFYLFYFICLFFDQSWKVIRNKTSKNFCAAHVEPNFIILLI